MSTSSPSPSPPTIPRRTKPAISIVTSASLKKDRRRSNRVSPFQPSVIVNGIATASNGPKSQNTNGLSGSDCQSQSIRLSESTALDLNIPSPKRRKEFHSGSSVPQYEYYSLSFTESSNAAESSTRKNRTQRCAAILESDVTLCKFIGEQSDRDDEHGVTPTGREEGHTRYSYAIDTARNLDGELGMVAQTFIPQGGVILVERPVIVVPTDMEVDASVVGLDEAESQSDLYGALFSRLDSQVRKEVLALKDCSASPNALTTRGIFHTNALDVRLEVNNRQKFQERKYKALFLKTSRCNHSCGPNAVWRFDRSSFTLTLSAVRAIHSGEEITISYINPFLPRHTRRTQLQSKWNFVCHCTHCDAPWTFPGAIAQSDKARNELSTFFKKLPDWEQWCLDENNEQSMIETHLRAMQMREKEGLEGFQDGNGPEIVAYMKHIDALVMCYGALADVQGFMKWVRKAREVKLAQGPDNALHVKVLDLWLKEPRKFYVWGWKRL
ncbi:hypothetical protein GGU11DRAFT_43970 [Lentinula aff. detonsa]|nr:hypothetical protein GGU11DRAFT_43970 [Lentinula aff. detonsa]